MGLTGTDGGSGSTVSVAEALQAPVILVLDARHQGQTAAVSLPASPRNCRTVSFAGVVLNRIVSPRHEELIGAALADRGIPCSAACRRMAISKYPHGISGWFRRQTLPPAVFLGR